MALIPVPTTYYLDIESIESNHSIPNMLWLFPIPPEYLWCLQCLHVFSLEFRGGRDKRRHCNRQLLSVMPKDIPEKLREDLAACRFRQKRVPYPSGSLRPSLSHGSGNANGLEEQRLGAERKLLEDILGRQPTATLASRLDDSCRGLSALHGGNQAATGRSGSGSAEAENAMPPPDIVSTMARRLSTVEAANRQLRTESTSQNKELLALKRENESLRLAVAEADDRLREQEHEKESARSLRTVLDEVAELQSENDMLKAQVDA